ncbi:DUF732 domain-containing protein [Actinomycetospora termitidis]|uniref:DUF732 domain-containing protein n=1 Tax=Actinomycetospora termitidis TaxID=3053470 RepID=A0ABT7MKG9_9PSEU|nr:DUF732 domain-containing protein [Actinomycetospora sp. Odt1-22]MDL5160427.1 DUF732 domain-containing protein [Actinomycetospora sp. Odt1-22]
MDSTRTAPAPVLSRSGTLVVAAAVVLALAGAAGCAGPPAPSNALTSPAAPAPPGASTPAGTSAQAAEIPSPSQAPQLSPEQRDDAFTQALASKNLQVGDEQTRTQVASSVCQSLDSGVTVPGLAEALRDALGGPTPENTGFIIGAATAIYCPANLPKLKTN